VAVRGLCWGGHCGHFEWSHAYVSVKFGVSGVSGMSGDAAAVSEISESGCVFGCGSGLGSGSGWVAVRGLDGACDCGHFEWSHAHVWMKFG
jgi:hypothetical protein